METAGAGNMFGGSAWQIKESGEVGNRVLSSTNLTPHCASN
jgi:hypothetical protein